jgi:hypothetical protein
MSDISRVTQSTMVEQSRAVAEVQAAVMVAQACPRDQVQAWEEMRQACSRKGLAERAFYKVPNRGSGPSVHLARELARIWGNVDYGVHELSRDDEAARSEIRAYAWDQQTNVRSSRTFQVPHARMAKGVRTPLTDLGDVYLNNQNIGARAVREAIFTVLPADFVAEAQDLCRATRKDGDGKPLVDRIASAISLFTSEHGVTEPRLTAYVGRPRGRWTAGDLADLTVVHGSLRRGESRAEDVFPSGVTVEEINAQAATATSQPTATTTDEFDPTLDPEWSKP